MKKFDLKTVFTKIVARLRHFFSRESMENIRDKALFRLKITGLALIRWTRNMYSGIRKFTTSGHLVFVLVVYIVLSIVVFLLVYNIWVGFYHIIKIPKLEGGYVLESMQQLQALNLLVSVETRYSKKPYGYVIKQDPSPGHLVKEKRTVILIVSRGPETRLLEDFTGKTLYYAEKKLQEVSAVMEREIVLKNVDYVYSDMYPKDQIISQTPDANTELYSVTEVSLTISKGKFPDKIKTGNYIGMTEEEALAKAKTDGFTVIITYIQVDDNDKIGKVIEQSIEAGKQSEKGTAITLTVGKKEL